MAKYLEVRLEHPLEHPDADMKRQLRVDFIVDRIRRRRVAWRGYPSGLPIGLKRRTMFPKACGIVILILTGLAVSAAQDPTKVESSHYKLAFENATVQVVNVHYGPHEKSGIHDHPGGVVVVITGGHLRFTDQNGTVTEVFSKPGESRWFPAFRHKVENVGDSPYNAVYIGMKGKQTAASSDPSDRNSQTDTKVGEIVAAYLDALHAK